MPHIHTDPGQHDNTSSAFIVINDNKPKVVLQMHKKLHKLLQPGGHIELSDDPWATALKEVVEETGYELSQLRVLQPKLRPKIVSAQKSTKIHPLPFFDNTHDYQNDGHHFHSDRTYCLVADGPPNGKPQVGESTDIRLLTLDELNALHDDEIWHSTRQPCAYLLQEYLPSEHTEILPLDDFHHDL